MSDNIPKTKEIELAVAETIAFLDIFDYPPAALEIWRFLGVKAELGEVVNAILPLNYKNGFYFLPGRAELVAKRSEFFHLAEKKYRIARRAANILKFVPGIKMVAVCNNFYYKLDSDIDFFIVVQSGRMWLTRALATLVLHFTRLRRHGNKIANRICLSFYVTDDNLNLENIALKPVDPYFNCWLAFLEPLYGLGVYQEFWLANAWIKKYLPNVFATMTNQARVVNDSWFSILWKMFESFWFNSFLGGWLELLAKKIQFSRMSKNSSGPGVIINDKVLKFHENDRREFFREQLRIKKNYLACHCEGRSDEATSVIR